MKKLTMAVLALTLLAGAFFALTSSAAEKAATKAKAKACPASTTTSGAMPGCPGHMPGATKGEMSGCSKHGAGESGGSCSMHGAEMGKGACSAKGEGAKCISMGAGMGKGACCAKGEGAKCGPMGAGMGKGACCAKGEGAKCGPMGGGMGPGMGCGPMGGGMGPAVACGPMGPGMDMARCDAALRDLDLTPEQQKKVQAIHETAQRSVIQEQADLRIAALDLQTLVHEEHPDRARIGAQIDKLAQLRAALQKTHMQAMLDVRALLTPEQARKLEALCPSGPEQE